jgi:hypothetical protein
MNTIDKVLPEGMLVNRKWLQERGFDRSTIDYYLRSGTLESVARGVYRKPGPPLKWQNIVYSLTQLGHNVHVGHKSSLQFYGYSQYVNISGREKVRIYGESPTPKWAFEVEVKPALVKVNRNPFPPSYERGIEEVLFGTWDWPIPYSTPERAVMEICGTIDTTSEILSLDKSFEGAGTFRPKLVQDLLEQCKQIKAKRLFLWIAKRHAFPWFTNLDLKNIDMGKGKRQIVPGGRFNSEFQITVPKELEDGSEEPLF